MFGRIILTQLKKIVRSKQYMFWTLSFPILLGSLFYFAFSSIYKDTNSKPIPVVIEVTDGALNEYRVMKSFSNLDRDRISSDYEEYNKKKAAAEAMGENFTEKEPLSKETLDKLEEVKCYEDMKSYDMSYFPTEYLKDSNNIPDEIKKSDLPFMVLMKDLEYEDGTKMIDIIDVDDHAEAETLLDDGDISGIITVDSMRDITLLANGNGVNHSILSTIISEYRLQVDMAIEEINSDTEELEKSEEVMDEVAESFEFVDSKDTAGDNKDPFVAYFYSLIAMIAVIGSVGAMATIVNNQANQSTLGIRIDCAPISKVFHEIAQLIAIFISQTIIISIALIYLIYILKIRFGGNTHLIFLTSWLANLVGITLGYMVAHLGTLQQNKKEAILMFIIVGGGFMSGLMIGDMKMIVEEHFPILNRINPSAVISDAFYALNVFGVGPRYYRSIAYMAGTSLIMLIIGMILSRKNSYKSL